MHSQLELNSKIAVNDFCLQLLDINKAQELVEETSSSADLRDLVSTNNVIELNIEGVIPLLRRTEPLTRRNYRPSPLYSIDTSVIARWPCRLSQFGSQGRRFLDTKRRSNMVFRRPSPLTLMRRKLPFLI